MHIYIYRHLCIYVYSFHEFSYVCVCVFACNMFVFIHVLIMLVSTCCMTTGGPLLPHLHHVHVWHLPQESLLFMHHQMYNMWIYHTRIYIYTDIYFICIFIVHNTIPYIYSIFWVIYHPITPFLKLQTLPRCIAKCKNVMMSTWNPEKWTSNDKKMFAVLKGLILIEMYPSPPGMCTLYVYIYIISYTYIYIYLLYDLFIYIILYIDI